MAGQILSGVLRGSALQHSTARRRSQSWVLDSLDREHTIDVSRAELENAGHPGHRSDRLDLHIHRVEDRSRSLRPLELEFQSPVCQPRNIEDADESTGV